MAWSQQLTWIQISTPLLTSHVAVGNCPSSLILGLPIRTVGLIRLTFQARDDRLAQCLNTQCSISKGWVAVAVRLWGTLGRAPGAPSPGPGPWGARADGSSGSYKSSSLEPLGVPGPWMPSWKRLS